MIKCCIFDLDGTLLNTLSTIRYYLNETLKNNGIEPITREACQKYVGNGARKLILRALLEKGIDDDATFNKVFSEYNAVYDADPYYLTEPYENISELVDMLISQGITLAVFSNKPDFATRSAISHFFPRKFKLVRGATDKTPLKPAPDGVFEILKELGFSPDECAYIGDSDVDVLTGKAAGVCKNIAVSWGFRSCDELGRAGAEIIVNSVGEILSHVL